MTAQEITFGRTLAPVDWPSHGQHSRKTRSLARQCKAAMRHIVDSFALDIVLRQAALAADRHDIAIDEWLMLKLRALHEEREALLAEDGVELHDHAATRPTLAAAIYGATQ